MVHQENRLEERLLSQLTLATRGDKDALGRAYSILDKEVQARNGSMAGTIAGLLKHADQGIRIVAALALGRFNPNDAKPHVEALARCMRDDNSHPVAGAAACALGQLRTPECVKALMEMLSDPKIEGGIAIHYFSALGQCGADAAEALPALSEFIARVGSDRAHYAQEALSNIQTAVRTRNLETISSASLPGIVDMRQPPGQYIPPSRLFAPHKTTVPSGMGMQVNRLFQYQTTDGALSCRIQIYNRQRGGHVVAIIADDQSHGTIETHSELIATAILHIYGLNPQTTSWLQHWSESYSGSRPSTSQISYKLHRDGERLYDPDWRGKPSFESALRELGVRILNG